MTSTPGLTKAPPAGEARQPLNLPRPAPPHLLSPAHPVPSQPWLAPRPLHSVSPASRPWGGEHWGGVGPKCRCRAGSRVPQRSTAGEQICRRAWSGRRGAIAGLRKVQPAGMQPARDEQRRRLAKRTVAAGRADIRRGQTSPLGEGRAKPR